MSNILVEKVRKSHKHLIFAGTMLIAGTFLFLGHRTGDLMEFPRLFSKPEEVRLVFVGDIMLSRNVGNIMSAKKDFNFYFRRVGTTTRSADIAFANLESPISARGIKSGSIYSFRADPRVRKGLEFAGFDVVSIANNHIWDYGRAAFEDTLLSLSQTNIIAVGGGESYTEAHMPKVIEVRGTKIALLAYTNLISPFLGGASSTPAVARFTDDILKSDIFEAKKLADVVVVSFHWGEEYKTAHNAEQERVGRLAIDEGATIVVGHHPHVVQEIEAYKDGYILYSLGNFVFDQNFSKDTGKGLLVEVLLEDSRITKVTPREVAFTSDYQPYFVK